MKLQQIYWVFAIRKAFLCLFYLGGKGLATNSQILRDAISRPNWLKVSKGNWLPILYFNIVSIPRMRFEMVGLLTRYYYLCYVGYPNAEAFLAPYREKRYHLLKWCVGGNAPTIKWEFFNMKYSSERNVIERVFQFLKGRWAILRGNLYYPAQTQCQTIVACCVLHNLINREMNNIEMTNNLDEGDSSYATGVRWITVKRLTIWMRVYTLVTLFIYIVSWC